jgi:hypothetical protein
MRSTGPHEQKQESAFVDRHLGIYSRSRLRGAPAQIFFDTLGPLPSKQILLPSRGRSGSIRCSPMEDDASKLQSHFSVLDTDEGRRAFERYLAVVIEVARENHATIRGPVDRPLSENTIEERSTNNLTT